jgi:LuxR family transcriptional regulator, maltose regulon positive regulatory protein
MGHALALDESSVAEGGTRERVVRPRIHELISGGTRGRLTMISAPPGAGKTVSLRSWLDSGVYQGTVVELALSPRPTSFWRVLADATTDALAVPPLDPHLPDEATAHALEVLLATADQPVLFAFDDLHALGYGPELAVLAEFVARTPPATRFVFTCRHDVDLGLKRARLYGELSEVRGRDLAFTEEEAAELFAHAGVDLQPSHVSAFVTLTDGWAAGLRFAALSAKACDDLDRFVARFGHSEAVVAEFLIDEVLDQLSPELCEFLLVTAQPDRICADLANAMTGRDDAARLLAHLERENAFLERVDGGEWFRYHALFQAFLRAEAKIRAPKLVAAAQAPAARWLADHGLLFEAVARAVSAADPDLAEQLVRQLWPEIVGQDALATANTLLEAVPGRSIGARPHLSLLAAWARLAAGDLSEADGWLEVADAHAPAKGDAADLYAFGRTLLTLARARLVGDLAGMEAAVADLKSARALARSRPDTERRRVIILCADGAAALWRNDIEHSIAHLEGAVHEARRLGLAGCEADASSMLALACALQGELRRAERLGQAALALVERARCRPGTAVAALLALEICAFEWDDDEGSERWSTRAAELTASSGDLLGETAAIAFAAQSLGRYGDASADDVRIELAGLSDRLTADRPPLIEIQLRILRSRLALGEQDLDDARDALDPKSTCPDEVIALARVASASAEVDEAERLLDTLLAEHPSGLRTHAAIEARIVRALVSERQGRFDEAREWIEAALEAAEPEGVRGPFIDAGPAILEPLRRTVRRGTAHRWLAAALLARFEGRDWERGAPRELLIPLSEKEKIVLRYLPTLLSNEEIAGEMFVSVNTVKTHLKSIYRKLAVSQRRDAVRRGRELRLLG